MPIRSLPRRAVLPCGAWLTTNCALGWFGRRWLSMPHVFSHSPSPPFLFFPPHSLPALRAYAPDLILISAGFDAAINDAGNSRNDARGTGGMNLSKDDFHYITSRIVVRAACCCVRCALDTIASFTCASTFVPVRRKYLGTRAQVASCPSSRAATADGVPQSGKRRPRPQPAQQLRPQLQHLFPSPPRART